MSSLEYSIEALDAKGLFYNKSVTVYVEGKDDVLFWSYLFELGNVEAYIEEVGGDKEIDKLIRDIVDNGAEFIVACDNDHGDFLISRVNHLQIIRTYGYSIENSMYCLNKIEDIIGKLSRQKVDLNDFIESWVKDFCEKVYELLVYDIANHRFEKGVSVFGDNCVRFLHSKNSHDISSEKVKKFIDKIKHRFHKEEISQVEMLLNASEKNIWFLIKGHFLTNIIMNLIKNLVKKISGTGCGISSDMIYALTIDCAEDGVSNIDISTMVAKIKEIKK